jgi:KDO2-lipid IV(A) lauroyltransferase
MNAASAPSWRREPVRWISHGFNNGLVFTLAYYGSIVVRWPFDALIIRIGALVLRRTLPSATAALIENLSVVFPADTRRQLYRRTLQTYLSYAWDYVDFIRALRWPREVVLERFGYEHGERLQGALAQGRGVILVTGHVGNWEAGAIVMRALGVPLTVVAMPEPDPAVNAYRHRIRTSLGVETLEVRQSLDTPLQIRRALAAGRTVALLMDRHVDRDRVPVTFFGRQVEFLGTPVLLAYLTGAPIVPMTLVRESPGRFRAIPAEPIHVDRNAPREQEMRRAAQLVADVLEAQVRARPECWYQFYPYFETAQTAERP